MTKTKTQARRDSAIIRLIQATVLLIAVVALLTTSNAFAAGGSSSSKPETTLLDIERLLYKEKYSRAIKPLEKMVKKDPDNADAWNLLGFALRNTNQLDDAQAAYTNALNLNPEHKGALEYQGELFLRLGEREAAEANLTKLKALCPNSCAELELLEQAMIQN